VSPRAARSERRWSRGLGWRGIGGAQLRRRVRSKRSGRYDLAARWRRRGGGARGSAVLFDDPSFPDVNGDGPRGRVAGTRPWGDLLCAEQWEQPFGADTSLAAELSATQPGGWEMRSTIRNPVPRVKRVTVARTLRRGDDGIVLRSTHGNDIGTRSTTGCPVQDAEGGGGGHVLSHDSFPDVNGDGRADRLWAGIGGINCR